MQPESERLLLVTAAWSAALAQGHVGLRARGITAAVEPGFFRKLGVLSVGVLNN